MLEKDILTCSQVTLSMWKAKYLSHTDEDPGLSSEDEATGLPPHRTAVRHLPSAQGGVFAPLPAPQPQLRVPTATTGTCWATLSKEVVTYYLFLLH